jgi:hypothetical protein
MNKTAYFPSAAAARAVGERLFAAGKVSAWSDYVAFGRFMVRVQINGRWFNLTNGDVAQVAA